MQFTIKVVSKDITTKPTAKGSYQMITLAFRNEQSGKLEEKKLVPFGGEHNARCFKIAQDASEGRLYEVTAEKGEQYWEWKDMKALPPDTVVNASVAAPVKSNSLQTTTGARTYETAEERAERQVLIVRQSSLSAAVATLAIGAKSVVDPSKVLELAQQYTNFVFQKEAKTAQTSLFTDEELTDIPNDL